MAVEEHEESHIERFRRIIEEQYRHTPLGSGGVGSFGEILCHELHMGNDQQQAGLSFIAIAKKWGISLPVLGDLVADHCRRLENDPRVNHNFRKYEQNTHCDSLAQ